MGYAGEVIRRTVERFSAFMKDASRCIAFFQNTNFRHKKKEFGYSSKPLLLVFW
jgi:hypothetical protein